MVVVVVVFIQPSDFVVFGVRIRRSDSQDFSINAVFAFREICSEELRVERQVKEVVQKHQGRQFRGQQNM